MVTAEFILLMIKSAPALILMFIIWPMTLGAALGVKKNLDRYLIGFAAVQALFFLVYIPAILFSWTSRTLSYSAAVLITAAGIAGTVIRYMKADSKSAFIAWHRPDFRYLKNPCFLIAVAVILYEVWINVTREPYIYGDDVSFISIITRFVDTNTIYTKTWSGQTDPIPFADLNFKRVFTSYYPLLGMESILSGLHPLILCKTVIPVFYIPVHYLTVWRIGEYLFGREKDGKAKIGKQSMFMFFYAILIEFGHISYYTMSRRVTIWIYNNKSDCFTILLPVLFFYTCIFLIEKDINAETLTLTKLWYRQFLIMIIALANNSATLMGLLFTAIVMVIWYIIAAIKLKKPLVFFSSLWTLIPHLIEAVLLIRFVGFSL
ncbi:MAG: hypothetical protein IKN80_08990 [Clostridiales bacterium]|nr:hypothetical protein [Clostridiales bacterium]